MLKYIVIFSLSFLLAACQSTQHVEATGHAHEEEGTSITVWNDVMELFAEISPLVVGQEAEALIHLTHLPAWQPVTNGRAQVTLSQGENVFTFSVDSISRPGIFVVPINPARAGEFAATFHYVLGDKEQVFDGGVVEVFASEAEMEEHLHGFGGQGELAEMAENAGSHAHAESDEHHITFLKEQQWKTDFSTAPAQTRPVFSSVSAVAEVMPHQHGYAEVVAPVAGLLLVQHNQEMVVPGKKVQKGDQLLVLCPPIGESNTWLDRQLAYERAQSEFERAEKLLDREAISQRDYEQIRQNYLREKSSYEMLMENFSAGTLASDKSCLLLRSPIAGIVSDVYVLPGQNVGVGTRLLTIVDPSIVWIRAQVYEKDITRLTQPEGLAVTVQGSNSQLEFNKSQLELISTGVMLDSQTRTIPVIFEVPNPNSQLKIGQILQAEIRTSEHRQSLTVPTSAIMDEEIEKVVFVQVEGEAFERRVINTGPVFGAWTAVTDGLNTGERVVTLGAYAVKLASTNVAVGSAHVH